MLDTTAILLSLPSSFCTSDWSRRISLKLVSPIWKRSAANAFSRLTHPFPLPSISVRSIWRLASSAVQLSQFWEEPSVVLPEALNMTFLALRCSRYINGVAIRHGELSQTMFPNYPIHSITNGVHAGTWACAAFQELFDRHIPEWRHDNLYLRYAIDIDLREIQEAHRKAKGKLLRQIQRTTGVNLSDSVATLGFARRAAEYKRADLLFADLNRLRPIRQNAGSFQIVFAGKAHPQDEPGRPVFDGCLKQLPPFAM